MRNYKRLKKKGSGNREIVSLPFIISLIHAWYKRLAPPTIATALYPKCAIRNSHILDMYG